MKIFSKHPHNTSFNKRKCNKTSETPSEAFTYKIYNNEVTITGYNGADSQIVIPEIIENLPVTTIDIFAFNENSNITNINTSNVSTIKDFAFASCISLETVIMPQVKTLLDNAFFSCFALNNTDMPNVISVGSHCFENCSSLQIVQLPVTTAIADFAFLKSGIKSVDLPNIEIIDTQSFSHCSNLESINLSKKLTTIGFNVFLDSTIKIISIDYGTDAINNVTLEDWNDFVSKLTELDTTNVSGKYAINNLYIKDLETTLIYAEKDTYFSLVSYTGPTPNVVVADYLKGKPVTTVEMNAFKNSSSIVSIDMQNISSIGDYAFYACPKLSSVIGNKVTLIGHYTFHSCTVLKTVTFPLLNYIYDYAFYNCTQLSEANFPNIVNITQYAFDYCYSLESVNIPPINFIDIYGFAYCIKITSIDLSNIKTLKYHSFKGCSSLTTVIISKKVDFYGDPFPECPIKSLTMYYGTEDISTVTILDWNNFVTRLELDPSTIPGKYVKNIYGIRDLSDTTPPVITLLGDNPVTLEANTPYIESGATVTDNIDTGLTAIITGNVDTTSLGIYYLYYNASDLSGNKATEVIRTVNVVDTTPPVVTLLGDNPMTMEVNTPYVEPGATVSDNFDSNLEFIVIGYVDITRLGTSHIYYKAIDSSGNTSDYAVRTVNVVDTTPPVVTLLGDNPMTMEVNTPYVEPGATVSDNFDSNLEFEVFGFVDITRLGTSHIYYSATDSSGNEADYAVRTVKVVDTTPPVITLLGDNPIDIYINTPYVEPGATVSDNLDSNVAVIITGFVDITRVGTNYLYYSATDSSGNKATDVVRTVNVIAINDPIITLNGNNPLNVEVNTPYIEPGATAIDTNGNSIPVIITGEVDTSKLGVNYVYYNSTDSYGNKADEVIRTVNVVDTTSPVINLNGNSPMNININTPYVEPGANVTDNFDTNLQPIITGSVDTSKAGEYLVHYNATDSSGNIATEAIRRVYVNDPINDFCYTIDNNEVTITCYRGHNYSVIIPETIENLPVTTIDVHAFTSSLYILSINTSNVTTINEFAFNTCQFLETAILPNVKVISGYAFSSCSRLEFVHMPKVTDIDTMAFANCLLLKGININENLSIIGTEIFSGSTMKNISIDYGTEDITNVTLSTWTTFVNKLTGLDLTTITGKYTKNNIYTKDLVNDLTYKEINSSLKLIDYLGSTADLTLPMSINLKPVTAIDNYVFEHCDSLININVSNVTTIGMFAFFGCTSLKSIIGNKVTTLGVSAIQSCNKITSLAFPELTTIDQMAFAYLTSLTSVSVPKLTTIKGDSAFTGCNSLQSIDLPSLTIAANYTFSTCVFLTDVNIPLVTIIGNGLFAVCYRLVEIDLSNITEIRDYAFYDCVSLNKVIISKNATKIGSHVFDDCPINNVTIYYGTEDISTVSIDDWNIFVSNMGLIPDSIPGKYVMNDYEIRDLSSEV